MRSIQIISAVALLPAVGILTSCRTTPLNKQEAAGFYARYSSMVRWVGYQGSDEHFHHFIARVMDHWNFIRIERGELAMTDERPFSKTSSAPLYYYLVDPSQNYQKIAGEGRCEPDGPANGSQPIRSETNTISSAAGSRR